MQPDRILTDVEAARTIFRTAQPTEEQLKKVQQAIATGTLKAGPRGNHSTTASALADFLARRSTAHSVQAARQAEEEGNQGSIRSASQDQEVSLPGVYRQLMQDYFLAVLLRRKIRQRSAAFQKSVLAAQFFLVLMLLVFAAATIMQVRKVFISPEQKIAQGWLNQQFDEPEILSVQPAAKAGISQVKFTYLDGKKRVNSTLFFTIENNRVVSVNSTQ